MIDHNININRNHNPNIVLCFDGTAYNFSPDPFTNILRFYRVMKLDDSYIQKCYYQPGIGVPINISDYNNPSIWSRFTNWPMGHIHKYREALFATTIEEHIIFAYKYLMREYKTGSKIYLFGFSSGAFIARILAGMIECIGLMTNSLEGLVPTVWKVYKSWEYAGQPDASNSNSKFRLESSLIAEVKSLFSINQNIEIEFLGLFDSVNSIGFLTNTLFPFNPKINNIKCIRHALSIDERRSKFKQSSVILEQKQKQKQKKQQSKSSKCDILELWFPGNHSDVGGSWPIDQNGDHLANIPLRWMISEAFKMGVKFRKDMLNKYNEKSSSNLSLIAEDHDLLSFKTKKNCEDFYLSYYHNENRQQHDFVYRDNAFSGRGNNSFITYLSWWFLEILPIPYKLENENGEWITYYKPNFGKKRKIPSNAKFHWSVKWREKLVNSYNPTNLPSFYDNYIGPNESIPDDYKNLIINYKNV